MDILVSNRAQHNLNAWSPLSTKRMQTLPETQVSSANRPGLLLLLLLILLLSSSFFSLLLLLLRVKPGTDLGVGFCLVRSINTQPEITATHLKDTIIIHPLPRCQDSHSPILPPLYTSGRYKTRPL